MAPPFLNLPTRDAFHMKHLTPLPFDLAWPEIKMTLASHRNLVLVAEPGAGKTTRFPAMLIEDGIIGDTAQVAVLEPRRLAARAAATRIASEREWPMKSKVGYSVRFDHQMNESTRLAFFTEGLFLKRLASNPTLKGIDCVVLDEFHERSRHTDLAIAALKELQYLERPDLRIVVMSATIDGERFARLLGPDAPVIASEGKAYPLAIRWLGSQPELRIEDAMAGAVMAAWRDEEGDILAFLPGVGEIERTRERLESRLPGVPILPLHGQCEPAAQRPISSGWRRLRPPSSAGRCGLA